MTRHHTTARSWTDRGGFTLIELMVALVLSALILAVAANAFSSLSRGSHAAEGSLRSSGSALKTSTWFADDVADARDVGSDGGIRRGQPGCGGDPTSILRFLHPSTTPGGPITVRSWSVADTPRGPRLERRTCSGATVSDALASTTRTNQTVDELAAGTDTVSAQCTATPGAPPAPATEAGDRQCRLVSMSVHTATGYRFTVEGRQRPIRTQTSSAQTERRCTLLASADTFVNSYNPGTNYGAADHVSVFERRTFVSGELVSLIKVDLGGRCTGSDEPTSLPGGKRITDARLRLKLIRYRDPALCHYDEAKHRFRVLSQPWDENSVTYNSWEGTRASQPGSNTFVLNPPCGSVRNTFEVPVLQETTQWYRGASRGGWANNGWSIDRGAANYPDDQGYGDGFWWGSRESLDSSEWPRLVITWE